MAASEGQAYSRLVTVTTSSEKPRLQNRSCELNIEHLVGRAVRDPEGKKVGRIEELIAEIRGTDWLVVEVHLGGGALLERLVDISTLVPVIGKLANRSRKRYRLEWGQLDLTDPNHPRSLVRRTGLERV
jgi:hypothetical protein